MNCLTKRQCVFLLFCIIHGSVVFGDNITKCLVDVYNKFPESKLPSQNFLDAFEGYNLRSFDGPRTSDNASGYFQDLVKPTEANENNFLSPQKYCDDRPDRYYCYECLFTLFRDPTLYYRENVIRLGNMSGYEAFKHVYLTQIYSEMTLDNFYPQTDYGLNEELYTHNYYEYYSRIKQTVSERKKNKKKFDFMMQYYEEFRRIASEISETIRFESVAEYCRAKALNQE